MDQKNFPYGNKSYGFLLNRTRELIDLLISMNCKQVLIACNTLSVMVLEEIKTMYEIKIYGITDFLTPYINYDNTAVIATHNTINSGYYQKILKGKNNLFLEETKLINKIEKNMDYKDELNELKRKLMFTKHLILGCTHFIKIKDEFKMFIDTISQDEIIKIDAK